MKTLVWFEPERVAPGTWLYNERPQWLLSVRPESVDADLPEKSRKKLATYKLLDLGNAEARQWLTDHVADTIREQGIDLYRQDFNIDPLLFWRSHDAPDRQGITEIRYVEGYLAFWTELRRRFPDMLIDSCASGGRRNDLETMRLSVPLHKTDYLYADLTTKQAFHHSLSSWLPYYGAYDISVEGVEEAYAFRSSLAPMTMLTEDLRRRDVDWAPLKRLTEEWRRVTATEYFYGDYCPLTPYNRDETQWIAWQFHRADVNAGVVQAFRRAKSPDPALRFRLTGLDPSATYLVTDMDGPDTPAAVEGRDLLENGLAVTTTRAPQALVIVYARITASS
jgi:alpha-galactosidase